MLKKILLMIILLSSLASAATIHGTVYDFGLEVQENAKVTIDTTPTQMMIAKDGAYSFDIQPGEYTIRAEYFIDDELHSSVKEALRIVEEGNYVLDLILLESLEDETSLLEDNGDFTVDPKEMEDRFNKMWWLLLIPLIGLAITFIYLAFRFIRARRYNEDAIEDAMEQIECKFDKDLEKLIQIIKDEGGRTTQKEIRKRLGLSEAKASLMITELEHKKIVKRIKKGRANVIIFS